MRLKPIHLLAMTLLISVALIAMSARAQSPAPAQLYDASGMATHQKHFQDALSAAQQRYAQQLPANLHATLVRQSNLRFNPVAMQDRARSRLAVSLPNAAHIKAMDFYRSPLGRKVVTLETRATAPTSVKEMQRGIPQQQVDPQRYTLVRQLSNSLPALEVGVEVSMALAGLATESANELLGGLFQVPVDLVSTRRQDIRNQMAPDLPDTLAYVYRDLSDTELQEYLNWSQSEAGQATFHAMELAAKDALNP
jgi:hypothetical protein